MPVLSSYNIAMFTARLKSLLIICVVSLVSNSCAGLSTDANNSAVNSVNANAVRNSAKKANDNAEELGLLLKLPTEPEDVVWRDEMVPTGDKKTERRVTAILFYEDKAVVEKIFSDASKHGEPQPVAIDVADWYPEELKAQSEFDLDAKLSGKSYPANEFFQEPLLRGRLIRVDGTEHMILELFAN